MFRARSHLFDISPTPSLSNPELGDARNLSGVLMGANAMLLGPFYPSFMGATSHTMMIGYGARSD